MRNFYAEIISVSNPNPALLAFPSDSDRDVAFSLVSNVGAELKLIYASDVKPQQRDEAIRLDYSKDCGTWAEFIKGGAEALGYDFGHKIEYCDICKAYTQHTDDGKCVICEQRVYKLSIWVMPRQSNHQPTKTFDPKEGYKDGIYWRRTTRRNRAVRFDETAEGIKKLSALITKAERGELRKDVFAIVTHDIMESPQIRNVIVSNKTSELNIGDIRWYYVRDTNGYLDSISAQFPPHWDAKPL